MALKRIVLRDFVIVEQLELELQSGFTVLTGETGAGKSILVDALQLATGARADTGAIREGAARTEVSVEFETTAGVLAWLAEAGFQADDTLLLRRTVDTQGKSRGWINGSPATIGQLRAVGEQLLDIHGQHAWQSLTQAESVRGLLDAYAGLDLSPLTRLWHGWRNALAALQAARAAQGSREQDRERLLWQIGEVDKLAPGALEWDSLNTEHGRLSNAQALMDAAQIALKNLDDDERDEIAGAVANLNAAIESLQQQSTIEPHFKDLVDVLASSLAQVEDTAHALKTYLRRTDLEPERLTELDARLALWMQLARRYKRTPESLATAWQSWKEDLAKLEANGDLNALEAATQTAEKVWVQEAQRVSKARLQAAPKLAKAVTAAMQGLGMQGGGFEVHLAATAQAALGGLEEVSFLMAGHPGATPRPVSKVASGGELSRMALAIAVTTSQLGTAQTLIFDEVDAGVGGAVAETVGRLMKQLGADRQVLAVTHLPQVAACADQHLLVSKHLANAGQGGQTQSAVATIANELRVAEIARMLGGERLSTTTLAHAREMLGAHS